MDITGLLVVVILLLVPLALIIFLGVKYDKIIVMIMSLAMYALAFYVFFFAEIEMIGISLGVSALTLMGIFAQIGHDQKRMLSKLEIISKRK